MHVIPGPEDEEVSLDRPTVAPGLRLRDPQAKSPVVEPKADENGTSRSSAVLDGLLPFLAAPAVHDAYFPLSFRLR